MLIYLVRHGIAEDELVALRSGKNDSERALTSEGIEKTVKVAKAFSKRVPELEHIFHSPYLRAKQTAEIFHAQYPQAHLEEVNHFRPHDSVEKAKEIIFSSNPKGSSIYVGHEPHLGHLLALLLTGKDFPNIPMKKAGIAGLEVSVTGSARLLFFVHPKFLLG